MVKLWDETSEDLFTCGVYSITNKINGKMYVGSTSISFYSRWLKHLKDLKKNKHHSTKLQNSVNKYGLDNFVFEILFQCDPIFVTDFELYWINLLNTVTDGYNMTYSVIGGCLGYKFSDEYKLDKSKILTGNKHRLGINHSHDSKNKISESVKKFFNNDSDYVLKLKKDKSDRISLLNKTTLANLKKKEIKQIDIKTGETINVWSSAIDVEKLLGFKATSITKNCKNKSKTAYGFKWGYN